MVIVSSGTISFSDLQTEFGGTHPISMNEYYADNASGYTFGVSGIPNTGNEISMDDFYGKSKQPILPVSSSISARYTAEGPFTKNANGDITQWDDLSGNNFHVTAAYFRGAVKQATFTKGSKGLVGTSSVNVVKGTNTDGLYFPFALTQGSYTFCYVARYTGDNDNVTYNRRIFDSRDGTGANTLWGFHDKVAGRSHNGNRGWVSSNEYKQSEPDWWMIGVDTEISCRYNGMDSTNEFTLASSSYPLRPVAGFNPTPSINFGKSTGQTNSNETSNWEVLELIFYNKELTEAEKQSVETYFASKYNHISFTQSSATINDFISNCSQQTVLYDKFYTIYDGYKWGYGLSANKWHGPSVKYTSFYTKNNRHYWIMNLQNGSSNNTNLKYSNGGNRNHNNREYVIKTPLNTYGNFKVHGIMNGGGGGGRARGGGAGGQVCFYNASSLYNKTLSYNIGNRGYSNAYNSSGNCSAGGDTIVSWDTTTLTAYGGYEGDNGSGGSTAVVNTPANTSIATYNGGNYGVTYVFRGGAISTGTTEVLLYSDTSFWNIINDSSITNVYSYNSGWWWSNIYGAGGMGYRGGGYDGDRYARYGATGGPGFIITIFDFN